MDVFCKVAGGFCNLCFLSLLSNQSRVWLIQYNPRAIISPLRAHPCQHQNSLKYVTGYMDEIHIDECGERYTLFKGKPHFEFMSCKYRTFKLDHPGCYCPTMHMNLKGPFVWPRCVLSGHELRGWFLLELGDKYSDLWSGGQHVVHCFALQFL